MEKKPQKTIKTDIHTVIIEINGDMYRYTFDVKKEMPYYAKLPDGSIWESNSVKMSYPPKPILWKKIKSTQIRILPIKAEIIN